MPTILLIYHHTRLGPHPFKQINFNIKKPARFLLKNCDGVFVHVISLNVPLLF
ncbi:hypothetical protein AJ73_00608 [Pseudomonas aeruginosa BWH033]|nr:hypothetical protein AJ73_00608 [Pseudomonas aeruginosa BWH033]